jgi:hypothetical protein
MRILNVIEIVDNLVISCTSFPIEEDQLSEDVIEKAEDFFIKKATENGFINDEEGGNAYNIIENAYYRNGNYSVNLAFS